MRYNFIRQTSDKGDLGYVCGEIFRVKNARLEGYKRFIVKSYSSKAGRVFMSIPMVEGDYDLLPIAVVDALWEKYCF
ncbi:hypothetical protein MASR2M36_36390 [Providencia sp.]